MRNNEGKPVTSKKKIWLALGIVATVLLITIVACIWYVNDYYHAEAYVNAYLHGSETVTVTNENNIVFLDGAGTEQALIFYPGAKVEYTAYVPLFYALAEQEIDCFVVKMPGNLAILGMNKAENICRRTIQSYVSRVAIMPGLRIMGSRKETEPLLLQGKNSRNRP